MMGLNSLSEFSRRAKGEKSLKSVSVSSVTVSTCREGAPVSTP